MSNSKISIFDNRMELYNDLSILENGLSSSSSNNDGSIMNNRPVTNHQPITILSSIFAKDKKKILPNRNINYIDDAIDSDVQDDINLSDLNVDKIFRKTPRNKDINRSNVSGISIVK